MSNFPNPPRERKQGNFTVENPGCRSLSALSALTAPERDKSRPKPLERCYGASTARVRARAKAELPELTCERRVDPLKLRDVYEGAGL